MIMNKTDYEEKMSQMLSDEAKFRQCNDEKNKTVSIEKQMVECLKRFKQQGHLSEAQFDSLKPCGSIIPRLYGLPKVHKTGAPLRPILDMRMSPYHSVAQWIAAILEPVRKSLCHRSLDDTFAFIKEIENWNVKHDFMCSLDVSSLFTNVPLLETIKYICDTIENSNTELPIPTTMLKELLLRCTMNVQFMCNNSLYRQIDGVAMGSPLGPILADIFMAKLENHNLKEVIGELKFYKRYVDDIFAITDPKHSLQDLLKKFNGAHSSIAFTTEGEADDTMNFLDVKLVRKPDGTLSRAVYHKPTWTGQYTNFHSFVPMTYKRNLVKCLYSRAKKICSPDTLNEELKNITEALRENAYPDKFISKNLMDTKPKRTVLTAEKKGIYIKLPFKGDLAMERINRKLRQSLKNTFTTATLRSRFSTSPMLSVNLKDKIPAHDRSMVIYSFSCCCSEEYVGRTTRRLSERIKEHHPAWLQTGVKKSVRSSIVDHLVQTNHLTDRNKAFKIVYSVPNRNPNGVKKQLLAIAESIAIRLRNPRLCAQKQYVRALNLPWPKFTPSLPTQRHGEALT